MQDTTSAPAAPLRVVLFMTASSAADVPAEPAQPACLLPFGATSFAERVLDSCARAGLKQVDLVVSDQPEALRSLLGDGWRWGLKLTWHLAKDAQTPYGVLHTLGLRPGQRVLIGHGHRWVGDDVVRQLAEGDRVGVRVGQAVAWTGWVSMDALFIHAIAPHADYEALAEVAVSLQSRQCVMVQRRDFAWAGSALELLQAQELALSNESGDHIPSTWLRLPWGAMSPDATVHPQARMTGPVLVGPGCMVARDASIGPGTVLSRDVLVANGAVVRDALVLPNTYVGGALTVDHAVVKANQVQDLRWSVRASLPAADGLLGPLQKVSSASASWTGRLLAVLLAVLLAPAALLALAWGALHGRPAGWRRVDAVRSRDSETGLLACVPVREPLGAQPGTGWFLAGYGALLDVVQARRHWFGLRARDEAQWYALRKDWQVLFSGKAVGFFHAPAWVDLAGAPDGEALAVADAWFSVHTSLRERVRTLLALARNYRTAEASF